MVSRWHQQRPWHQHIFLDFLKDMNMKTQCQEKEKIERDRRIEIRSAKRKRAQADREELIDAL